LYQTYGTDHNEMSKEKYEDNKKYVFSSTVLEKEYILLNFNVDSHKTTSKRLAL